MTKYSIGVDYGTLSARALLVDLTDGSEVAESVCEYSHAILSGDFFEDTELENTDAFQHPQDYLDALVITVKELLETSGVSPTDIVGIGFDFTSCTVLPVDEKGTPLCFYDKYKQNPQAYAKLWKHHSAQQEADEITELAEKENVSWLSSYGNKVSSEWLFPKLFEVYHKAPDVYDDTFRYIEAGDWLVWMLTGREIRSSCMAGYKALWNKKTGYPENEFWAKYDKKFSDIIGTKISCNVLPAGTKAGMINSHGKLLTGLEIGTAVAVSVIDAHAALPAAGVTDGGKLMLIIGTSACHIVMSEENKSVKGICGSVEDGIIPGLVAYEAGQSAVGDIFDWFVNNCVPEKYTVEAKEQGKSIFAFLDEKAAELEIGESGIIALDWWNGNRSPYADYSLLGMLYGLTLKTKPEDIYRGILESTAFGTKAIVDLYEENGIEINEVYAAGGISQKNSFLMHMYADVLGKEIQITASTQAGAKGSAIFASVAGGYFKTAQDAAQVISDKCEKVYYPNPEKTEKYETIYKEYRELSEYFTKRKGV
ncbi:MAG: ribulokinase [Ruminococcaceae bacterium]|nr:ribulokinase [Oscillospiraceae bacterium]